MAGGGAAGGRSAGTSAGVDGFAGEALVAAVSCVPHWLQNFASGTVWPQLAQRTVGASEAPHSVQNFANGTVSPQLLQRTVEASGGADVVMAGRMQVEADELG